MGCGCCLGAITISGDDVTSEPAYYIIGQASKVVRPGSVRVASNEPENLPNVAFRTPDGKTALILQNKAEEERIIKVEIGEKHVSLKLPAGAVGTLSL